MTVPVVRKWVAESDVMAVNVERRDQIVDHFRHDTSRLTLVVGNFASRHCGPGV